MKQAILDTSFILTCVRQKIDFFEYLEMEGFQILIPDEVLRELKGLGAELALKILKNHSFKKVELNSKNVDNGIIKFAKADSDMIIGTLDMGIKKKAKNHKLVIREKKRLEII